ncbi:MAG: IS4 family transposase [Romboutsia sp.]|nr:IS4 family transposase [Romboutsia sp.]
MVLKEYIAYIFSQRGNTNFSEAERFYKHILKNFDDSITPQAIGKQRYYISSKLFLDMFEDFIDDLYDEFKGFSKYKEYIVTACDGSIFDLPVDNITAEEMNVKRKKNNPKYNSKSRMSCIIDVNSRHILTAENASRTIKETDLAFMHLLNLQERFDISKLITIYDRGYISLVLMILSECLGAKFLIRLKSNTFKHKIDLMGKNDGKISINITNSILDEIEDEELKIKADKIGRLELRIVKFKLKNNETEILATNLEKDEFSINELKELYGQRWEIETGFDRLKNLVLIEDFSGRRKRIIEQDFYASLLLYNIANTIKNISSKRIMRQPRKRKHKYKYVPNFSKIITLLYTYIYDLLSGPPVMTQIIMDYIVLKIANNPTNVRIDDDNRMRNEKVDSTNSHNSYKKNPMP